MGVALKQRRNCLRQRRSTQEKLESGLTSLQLIAMARGRPWRTGSRPALFEAVLQSGYAALEQLENCPQATTFRLWKIRIHTETDFGRTIRPVGRPQPVRSPRIMVGLGAFFTSCGCSFVWPLPVYAFQNEYSLTNSVLTAATLAGLGLSESSSISFRARAKLQRTFFLQSWKSWKPAYGLNVGRGGKTVYCALEGPMGLPCGKFARLPLISNP